ncbi:MAG: hypothetical protein AAF686_00740 [Pseudomonadota bacterium]
MRLAIVSFVLGACALQPVWGQSGDSGGGAVSEARQETCRITSGIVATAVAMRLEGSDSTQTKDRMTGGAFKVDERYLATVGPLVDWVFTINDTIMNAPDASQTVSGQFQRECLVFAQ